MSRGESGIRSQGAGVRGDGRIRAKDEGERLGGESPGPLSFALIFCPNLSFSRCFRAAMRASGPRIAPKALPCILYLASCILSSAAPPAAPDWPSHPGDIDRAAEQLEQELVAGYRGDIMASFSGSRELNAANAATEDCARRILALYHMGKLSVHSDAVKRAFVLLFLKAHGDPTRHHEMIELYERIAVPNSDDPFWRIIRARCARRLKLREWLPLCEQVAKEMTGVPPDDEVRKLWAANQAEFELNDATKRDWQKQAATFIDADTGLDAKGAPPIDGNLFPLLDFDGSLDLEVEEWQDVLAASPKIDAMALDRMMATAAKGLKLEWKNKAGFLSGERALTMYLLALPPTELAELRAVQEAGYRKASAGSAGSAPAIELFRRYRWSESAQRKLMESARQHLFAGEAQAAFRCFEDVLRHAVPGALRDEAQVGLWVSLAQFAEPEVLARAFEGVNANATWPWNGTRAKTATIRGQLVPKTVARPRAPTLASLAPKIVRLPLLRIGAGQSVFSVDMQRDGDGLLVSNPTMLALYAADNPAKPLWIQNKGTGRGSARFVGQRIVTPFGDENRLVSLRRADGTIDHEGNPMAPHARYRYGTIGGPTLADNRDYAVQIGQDYKNSFPRHTHGGTAHLALSCFGSNLEHLWTRQYKYKDRSVKRGVSVLRPRVSQGAVFFQGAVFSRGENSGRTDDIIRADCRDGETEWRYSFSPDASGPASPWFFGGEPVVTDKAVICLLKSSGRLLALDKETGRRRWTLPFSLAYEMLGRHEDLVVLTGPNTVYALDVYTGKMRWGRPISPVWSEGFQLPHAQLIGDSVYCGTKNELFRFDARNGARLESRPWKMGAEAPMCFHVAGSNLYVVSNLPLRDARRERQLVDYHNVIVAAAPPSKHLVKPLKLKDGSTVHWRDLMLLCIKDKTLLWSRFICTASERGSGWGRRVGAMSSSDGTINAGWPGGMPRRAVWPGGSARHDLKTGQLLQMGSIKIGEKK